MNCCCNCFSSPYLYNIISTDTRKGDCDFCSTKDISIYTPRELIPFFRNILNLYELNNEFGSGIIIAIEKDFNNSIFSNLVQNKTELLRSIVSDELEEFEKLFTNKVSSTLKDGFHLEQSQQIHNIWSSFKDEIRYINRFHIQNTIELPKLKKFFENESFHTVLKKGRIFYRSRISDKLGYNKSNMGNPPKEKATAGRANPKGISYLYLADDVVTSIYEARATLYDYVSIGDFRLVDDIKILNLRQPSYDPISWSEEEAIDDYIVYVPFIKTLQKELSLPIRRLDKEIDYIPTQYLSEFIKSIGFDGVEFQSSLYSRGYNLAIFYPDKFECINADVYEIESIDLKHKKL